MIYRVFPTKDTFITSFKRYNVPMTASNLGGSEILQLFKVAPYTGSQRPGLARILMKFDLSEFMAVTGSASDVKFRLRLKNADHYHTLPSSYDIAVQPVTQDWDEGRGLDTQGFTDKGYANWDKAKANYYWSVTGSVGTSPVDVFHVDEGHEDLSLDVTDIVQSWLAGASNFGFLIKLSGSAEEDGLDYFVKMFHSRQTFFKDYRPYLEASWDDSVRTGSVHLTSDDGPFVVNITNLKDEYELDEKVRLKVYCRKVDYNPAVVLTASSDALGLVVDKAYYRISNDRTDEVVVPFGTGSVETTRLSYNASGSYFDFYMKTLSPGEVYRVAFLFDSGGQRQLIDDGFKFRVI